MRSLVAYSAVIQDGSLFASGRVNLSELTTGLKVYKVRLPRKWRSVKMMLIDITATPDGVYWNAEEAKSFERRMRA